MSKVSILSPEVVSRIAAGEVVERPASVVKELVENSLDAGATRIEVHLKDGGKSLIHIRDNGAGIARDDLAALFNRHATSKIRTTQDLEEVLSFGFRGEALYSVGAIAQVSMKSLAQGATDTWELKVNGGARGEPQPAAMPAHGTDIRVEGLFFNTPARRKFLKSDTAEAEAAIDIVTAYALLRPDVHFVVTHNARTVFDLSPEATASRRVAKALKLEEKSLHEGSGQFPEENIRWRIVLGDINIRRNRRDLQYIFVNSRPVQSKGLAFHINESFGLIFPPGTYGFFAVMLEVPPQDVDVNVHPAKREVRLKRENDIGLRVRRSVENLLMTQSPAREVPDAEPLFPFSPAETEKADGVPADKIIFSPKQGSAVPVFRSTSSVPESFRQEEQLVHEPAARVVPVGLKDRLTDARFVGTFNRKYHLFEESGSLFVVDQHAAQERILFEKFRSQMASGSVEVQHLLMPLPVRVTPREMLSWEELAERISMMGFEVTLFDNATIALHAHPVIFCKPEEALRMLLDRDASLEPDPDVLARRACRASVMAGDVMTDTEAAYQLKALLACSDPYTCPHGRPVVVELKDSFLDRQFLR